MCFRETPFTALQQGDINDLLRVSVPVQINRVIIILYYCIVAHPCSKSMDQPGKVANPNCGQLNKKNEYFLVAFVLENLVSRNGFGSPVPRKPAHLHTQAKSGAYLRDSSRVPRRRPFINLKPPYAIGSVPSLSGHANAYRWRPMPRVRRHTAIIVPNECCVGRSP